MEVIDNREQGFIEVWLTNEEQAQYDRNELTRLLLSKVKNGKKCRVVFFMSGNEELKPNIERLLLANLKSC